MNTHRFLCFGRNDENGNAAIVVEDSNLVESERLKFAQLQDANATVFITGCRAQGLFAPEPCSRALNFLDEDG
ncbi:hypothetical protein [Paraburkholderia graminis]|uniref:hypothetical protein n=1 Tax=Paraburkholderia graminis TaxID=60548 RepID=UPI0038B75D99